MPGKAWKSWWNGWQGNFMELQPLYDNERVGGADATEYVIVTPPPPLPPPPPSKISLTQETSSTLSSVRTTDDLSSEEVYHDLSQAGQSGSVGSGGGSSSNGFFAALSNFFGPTDLPEEIQLLRLENLGVPVCYLVVGVLQGLFRTLLNVYPLGLGATEAQQTTLATIVTVPAAFKILYGITTDNVPLYGYRRKPYIFLGWLCASSLMFLLMATSDLTLSRDSTSGVPIPPENAPSMMWLSIIFFSFGISMWFADATADALVAEKARCEPVDRRGGLQSTCYACRFFGLMVSAPLSSYLYTNVGPQTVVHLLMLVPTVMFPLSFMLKEERHLPIASVRDQFGEIWQTVCSRSVWEPLGFLYLFNLLQVPNAAWRQFLRTVLHFTDNQLNALLVASYVLLYAGTMFYKYFFLQTSWRRVYLGCILMNAFFSGMQLLLIRGRTLGLSPFLFALGDDAMAEFIAGIQFLPCTILMVALTPKGSEGAAYAMYTTVWNSAMMIAPAFASVLLGIWDTSAEALEAGQLDGLFNLSVLTTVLQILPIFFLCWMPHGREDMYALAQKTGSGHPLGGVIFLTILGASVTYTMAVAVLNIVYPGWAGGS